MTEYIITAVVCYLIGSISPSYIIGKKVGNLDIRKEGSNNAGASNVAVTLGWKWAALTAFIDVIKGLFTVFIVRILTDINCAYVGYLFVVLGHIFPFYMGFKGGKGLATSMGAYGALAAVPTLLLLAFMIAVTVITGYISISTLSMAVVMFLYTVHVYGLQSLPALMNGILSAVVIAKHFVNIKRMIKGEEISLWTTIKKNKQKKIEE
ncbi:MAG: glycerol-3-phosphate acyltransferase [Anaerofustis stercorihominis]|nr:glycerol-3-phosphate acyltransferase [Anaerofustis stercorihominis]